MSDKSKTGDEDEGSRGFQVRDRRRFNEAGDAREDVDSVTTQAETKGHAVASDDLGPRSAVPEPSAADDESLPPINFSTFVMSLSTQALLCLGDLPDPTDGEVRTDLSAARELIDILGMLKDKTTGNLDPSESSLLEKILFDLRMRYVRRARS